VNVFTCENHQCFVLLGEKNDLVQLLQRIFLKEKCQKNSGIAIFEQLVPAGHKNVAGFLRFFTFISDL
jgi:hypothetical protein